jgi:phage-related protein
MDHSARNVRRRWRHYTTPGGRQPTLVFLDALPRQDHERVVNAMRMVSDNGLHVARHLRGDLHEVRVTGARPYRVLFAVEGHHSQILLALHAFAKRSQKTPQQHLRLAEQRLFDWRRRSSVKYL